MSEFSERIKSRPRKTVPICLDPGLQSEWESLREQLSQVTSHTVNDPPEVERAREALAAVESELAAATVEFVFESLPRRQWSALVAKHSPRPGNDLDKMLGYDVDAATFDAAHAGLVEPTLDDDDWAKLDDNLSAGQWEQIKNAVLFVNAGKVDVPFWHAASLSRTVSDAK